MTNTNKNDVEREEFEELCAGNGLSIERRDGSNSLKAGDYKDQGTKALWDWHHHSKALPSPTPVEAGKDVRELVEALNMLERVENRQIAIWKKSDHSGHGGEYYETWNDGEYWVSKATKMLRKFLTAYDALAAKKGE